MSTLEIIAREVGVSSRTVSNVLNGKNKENWDSTARRATKIREVAERVGYQPNVMARAVATGKSRVIGLVIYEELISQAGEIENGVLKEVSTQGYTTKLIYLRRDPQPECLARFARECCEARLEGVVALCVDEPDMPRIQNEMRAAGCPLVFVGNIPPADSLGVYSDIPFSLQLGFEHLAELGHRRIGFLCGPREGSLTQIQMQALPDIARDLGLPYSPARVQPSDWSNAKIIEEAAHRLLDLPEPPTAIFAVSCVQALVTLAVARRRGLRLPDELSVLCYGQMPLLAYTDPPLTTIVQPTSQIGHLAVQCLIAHLETATTDEPCQPLLVKDGIYLAARGSTAPPKNS